VTLQQELVFAPVVSRHDTPQVSPQEWDCGCVTAAYVTDDDVLYGGKPFQMRLLTYCGGAEKRTCGIASRLHADDLRSLAVALVDLAWGSTVEFSWDPFTQRDDYDASEQYMLEHTL